MFSRSRFSTHSYNLKVDKDMKNMKQKDLHMECQDSHKIPKFHAQEGLSAH